MAKIHIRMRKDSTYGLYTGKTCLAYGDRKTIERIGFAIRVERQVRKAKADA